MSSNHWRNARIAMIDTETGGLDPLADRVIEIAVVVADAGQIVDRRSWLVNPGAPIAAEATKVHGITDEMVQGAPSFAEVAVDLALAVEGAIPAAYNAPFDRGFVGAEWVRTGFAVPAFLRRDVEWVDAYVFAKEIQRFAKGKKRLGDVAARFNLVGAEAHRAAADAELAMRVLFECAKDERMPGDVALLLEAQALLRAEQEVDFIEWKRRQRESEAASKGAA